LNGQRQLIFLTGEAGIGKTTLLQAFVEELHKRGECWLLQGQCLDQHGVGEAYMPLLSALGRLCRQPGGEAVTALLMQCAPTWLVQMPWLVSAGEFERLQKRTVAANRERMLREMVETLECLSEQRPLTLLLEDLHWSDYSTLDLLSCLARRRESARLLVIGTYRPSDARASGHPLRPSRAGAANPRTLR
jgi:predicted ATPase